MTSDQATSDPAPTITNGRRARRRARWVGLGAAAVVLAGVAVGVAVTRGATSARQGAYVTYEQVTDYFPTYRNGSRPVRYRLPFGVAVDGNGKLYVADTIGHQIHREHTRTSIDDIVQGENGTPSGPTPEVLAGTGDAGRDDGASTVARFNSPGGLAVNANGTVFVADTGNNAIRKVTPTGVVTTLPATGVLEPYGIAVDGSGNVYVADTGNHRIRKITPSGAVSTLAGAGTAGFADGTGPVARFSGPRGVAVDGSGNVYVADTGNHRIRKITPSGAVSTLAGAGTAGFADGTGAAAQFSEPSGLTVSRDGVVFVADTANHRIRKVTPARVVTTVAGSGVAGDRDVFDEPLTNAEFDQPFGVVLSPGGALVVADTFSNRVRLVVLNW